MAKTKEPKEKQPKPRPGDSKRLTRGRQPVITPEKVKILVEAVGGGVPKKQAAAMAKINYHTYRNWILRGEEAWEKAGECDAKVKAADRLYVNLFTQTGEKRGKVVEEALANIRKAGKKNWQADAWLLSRLCPVEFADNRHELNQLKKAFAELLKEMAEYQNTKTPEPPTPPPPELPPADLVPVPTPGPAVPEATNPTAEPPPLTVYEVVDGKKGE